MKQFTYRSFLPVILEEHADHWDGFLFFSGNVMVCSMGNWGRPEVWASSVDEGKRVIRHAASICGWDPDDPKQGQWVTRPARGARYGRVYLCVTAVRNGLICVTSREGPNGLPEAVQSQLI